MVYIEKEFSSFEKLVDKKTGVGWDHEKKTILADDDWWAEKNKDLDILKWKHGGSTYIDLLDKCFKVLNVTTHMKINYHVKDQNLFLKRAERITQLLRMKEIQIVLMLEMKYNPT
ncbi:unnamed protein product [Lathyrus sativus]|nr:unnamed protein product [Lathyrus sativus]